MLERLKKLLNKKDMVISSVVNVFDRGIARDHSLESIRSREREDGDSGCQGNFEFMTCAGRNRSAENPL